LLLPTTTFIGKINRNDVIVEQKRASPMMIHISDLF
jgi:hypothetical protein